MHHRQGWGNMAVLWRSGLVLFGYYGADMGNTKALAGTVSALRKTDQTSNLTGTVLRSDSGAAICDAMRSSRHGRREFQVERSHSLNHAVTDFLSESLEGLGLAVNRKFYSVGQSKGLTLTHHQFKYKSVRVVVLKLKSHTLSTARP
jgi:hypothetical protein